MEKVKDPAMVLAIVNSVGLIGTSAYFYKQLEAVRTDMVKITQTLSSLARKVSEIEKHDQGKGEAMHALNEQIKNLNDCVEGLPSFTDFDNLNIDLDALVETLGDNEIEVVRPSLEPKSRPQRYDNRRQPPPSRTRNQQKDRELDDEQEYERPTRRTQSTRGGRGRGRGQSPRAERKSEPRASSYEEDDTLDLINAVRQKQTH